MRLNAMENATGSLAQHSAGSGSQIRSRVTVVCAECKRLKLKCDRRTPCSSCLKRDTVPRCTYSAAAAEKIDVQSLHNRVLALEAQLSHFTSAGLKVPAPEIDRALLAVGACGSSVLVPLDDIAGVWIEDLNLGREGGIEPAYLDAAEVEPGKRKCSTHGDSAPSSPHSASPTFSPPSLNFSILHGRPITLVTPALLALLPSASQRPSLLDVLGSVLRMHPSINFPHFRARINAMFVDGVGPDEIEIGPARTTDVDKPSITFFASAAAGFALAMQCMPETAIAHANTPASSSLSKSAPSVSSLLTLSGHVLNCAEDIMPYDLDFLHALILRCLCMLHDGMPCVSQAVFAIVGKMVNIARIMGLARDPAEFSSAGSKCSLWDVEMRRRMWWDVFYYDLFVSDCVGLPPLISDDQHSCRMPADVDEDAFVPSSDVLPPPVDTQSGANFSYFLQKCKLAQLVKNTKKRTSPDVSLSPGGSAPLSSETSLDAAIQAESEIQQYLSDLPPAFKLEIDTDLLDLDSKLSSSPKQLSPSLLDTTSPHLMVQRCELFTLAHQLVLKLFHPFLRRSDVRPPHNALVACINATHGIIQASKIVRAVWQKHSIKGTSTSGGSGAGTAQGNSIPSSHGIFYPFARQLFNATVMAAHVVIQTPQSVFAKVALDDVRTGLEVMRDPLIATGRGRSSSRGGVEGCPSEAVRIVEMMLHKAEAAKRNLAPVAAGTKRKHEEVDLTLGKGFWLPYVGSGVATEKDKSESSGGPLTGSPASARSVSNAHSSPRVKLSESTSSLDSQANHQPQRVSASASAREKEKERKYPAISMRTRATSIQNDRHSTAATLRSQREPSPPTAPSSGEASGHVQSSAPRPSSPAQTESLQYPAGEFSLSASFSLEDPYMVNMTVSPVTPAPASQMPPLSYPSPAFQSTTAMSAPQQRSMYEPGPYESSSTQRPIQQPYYVPYPPHPTAAAGPPPESPYQPIDRHAHARHGDIDVAPLGILQNQPPMAALSHVAAAVAKREEGADQEGPHASGPAGSFGRSESWDDTGVAMRFSTQPTWDHPYTLSDGWTPR